jgi:hypothetical protein
MTQESILSALIVGGAAIVGALIGGLFPWLTQRDQARLARAEKRVARLEEEVRARMDGEEAAVAWIAELRGRGEIGDGLKRQLRDRGQQIANRRPKMSPSDLSG